LISPSINDLWINEENYPATFWIATHEGLSVVDYSNGIFSNSVSYTESDGLLSSEILSLGRDKLGVQYAASSSGINYHLNNVWNSIIYNEFPLSIPDFPIRKIRTHKESLYIATSGGIGRFVNSVDGISGASRWTSEYGMSPLSGDITAIFVDSKGKQWFGTSEGLQKHEGLYAKADWSLFTTEDGLVNNYILDINESGSGDIWVATQGGISIYNNSTWTSLQRNDGLICDTVYDIAFDTDESVWLATHEGVSHYKNSSFENYIVGLEKVNNLIPFKIINSPDRDKVDFVFDLTESQFVNLSVFNISGQLVSIVGNRRLPAGRNTLSLQLNSENSNDQRGIYIYRFQSPELNISGKFLLIR
jgi:hypothetical protein